MHRNSDRRARQRGQVLPIAALLLPVLVGFSVLAIDTGYNFADRRALQGAADQGALAGASDLAAGTDTVLQTAQNYAWRDLKQNLPAAVATSCKSVTTCTVGPLNGYTITATAKYTPHDTAYSANNTVSVDIKHSNPGIAFEGFLGIGSVNIGVHAAATSEPGQVNFPFALATRFLDLVGNSAVSAYGAVLVGQCSDGGAGDFVDNNTNGGIRIGGQSEIDLGQAHDSNGNNTSAQALLLWTPGSTTCTNAPNTASNGSASWSTFGNKVNFDASDSFYNYYYGFNAGPGSCASSSSSQSSCTSNLPVGNGVWQDSCWTSGNQSVAIKTTTAYFTANVSGVGSITAGVASPCLPTGSHEGSFRSWPGLPAYSTPGDLAANNGVTPQYSGSSSTLTAGAGTTTVSTDATGASYFNSTNVNSKATLKFSPGVYTFDGSGASISLGSGSSGSLTCLSGTSSHLTNFSGVKGCVFIFENGASLSMQSGSLNCSDSLDNTGNCAFEFDGSGSLSMTSGLNASMHPIGYQDPATGTTYRMPLVYSTNSNNCFGGSLSCAITMSSSGATFDVRGTLYARNGIISINANAQPVSGQVIADTVELQSGSAAAPGGVAYNGSAVAPAAAPAALIE